MSKAKKSKGKSIANRHILARASYLHQAATYLQFDKVASTETNDENAKPIGYQPVFGSHVEPARYLQDAAAHEQASSTRAVHCNDDMKGTRLSEGTSLASGAETALGQQRYLLSHIHGVAQKSRIKLSPGLKRTICKRCYALLTPGLTSCEIIENNSKNGEKSWADVHIVRCTACGAVKRYPVGAKRQPKKKDREQSASRKLDMTDQKVAALGRQITSGKSCYRATI